MRAENMHLLPPVTLLKVPDILTVVIYIDRLINYIMERCSFTFEPRWVWPKSGQSRDLQYMLQKTIFLSSLNV